MAGGAPLRIVALVTIIDNDPLIGSGIDVLIDLRDPAPPAERRTDDEPSEDGPVHRRRWPTFLAWSAVFAFVALLLVPTALGYNRYAITGGSMDPTFAKGSAVFSEDVPVTELAVGDVITYLPPESTGLESLVTHRIVDISRTEDGLLLFRTKGDANEEADPWEFTLDSGRQDVVAFSIPHLGTALTHLADPDVRQLVIGIPAGFIALGALAELFGVAPLAALRNRRRGLAAG